MDTKTESGSGFSLVNSCMATLVCSEPSWRKDVGQFAGSSGVSAGVVVEKSLVWVAWEGPKGVCWFPAGWGGQSGRGEALSQLQLPSLGPAFKPCWSHLFHYQQEREFSDSWMKIEMHFSLHSWASQSPFYLYCWEDPSWPCSAGCLTTLWIPLFNCHLVRLWDP